MIDAVQKAAYGANGPNGELRAVVLTRDDIEVPPLTALMQAVGVDAHAGHFSAMRALAKAVRDRRSYLFIATTALSDKPVWWDEVRDIVENCGKTVPPAPIGVVTIDTHYMADWTPEFDFSVGWPTDSILDCLDSGCSNLWRTYVHHRIAWESAGNVGTAQDLDEFVGDLAVGDDEGLDRQFGEFAKGCFTNHSHARILVEYVCRSDMPVRRRDPHVGELRDELLAAGLLWRPPSATSPRVVPWAAREILRVENLGRNVWQLRANLVCASLAAETMRFCLQGESDIRSALSESTPFRAPAEDTKRNFERFRHGDSKFVQYPQRYPRPPTSDNDVWGFASLGELLGAHPSEVTLDGYRELLHLRNAVAHGHYVTWQHVLGAQRLRQVLR
jgi:hypothetical protein